MSLQNCHKNEKQRKNMRHLWPWPTYKQRKPIRRLQRLHVAVRHSNYLLSTASGHTHTQPMLMIYLLFLLPVCFIGLSINQSINRLVYRQTALTEFKSKLTKYAIVTAIPMQFANRLKYRPMLITIYSIHTDPTFSSGGTAKNSADPVQLKLWTKSPPLKNYTKSIHVKVWYNRYDNA